ncbi:hypothetical protein [Haloquadratum walsbyi]|uniref:Uncharacterized protein n=1 Tax=Haloquadratum walsbyi J07HQW2 TaxID=1238425 RepID=U1PSB7_9EURY|nr:hypothetical protein [Haloquadratum walsbyi]ERG95266.1 MAG: hypothetical protein J07HQW2_01717 [Haloquadratum walsbyi J07HQW2]
MTSPHTPDTTTDTSLQSVTTDDTIVDESPLSVYESMMTTSRRLTTALNRGVITPVAKHHFATDRGYPVTQELPDHTEPYQFNSHNFKALVRPDEREVCNEMYDDRVITPTMLLRNPSVVPTLFERAETLWEDTFDTYQPTHTQPDHPGPFPFQEISPTTVANSFETHYETICNSQSLAVAIKTIQEEMLSIVADLFETSESELHTPGGTDLSALARADSITVPYNDDLIAILCPATTGIQSDTPTRGVIVGCDDTPVGLFAHVTDVTALDPTQETTHAAIRDAMGFDRELNPHVDHDRLNAAPGERIRLQGDLRVERTDDLAGFPEEIARTTRRRENRRLVDNYLESTTLPAEHIWGRSDSPAVNATLTATVSETGAVVLEPATADGDLELLSYVQLLFALDHGPAVVYTGYDDVSYIRSPRRVGGLAGTQRLSVTIETAREEASRSLEAMLETQREDIEATARDRASDARVGIDIPKQVNLPVDNHLTFIEAGYAPAVETEPVPVAVPSETTLHIVHDEHNTVTVQVAPGVYRFSLLPRGLQPPADRPTWSTA